tara:strand:+ start:1461 stop:1691 length:231 start_codon:yes stop_codon:yes gene_type:complete
MSWKNTIKKEDSNDEDFKDFIDLINLNVRMYEKSNNIKYVEIIKAFAVEEIKRRGSKINRNYPLDDDVGENLDEEV